jgi:polyisoprenyl-teichoic acid--peptidoglycan teichoic acid transferase
MSSGAGWGRAPGRGRKGSVPNEEGLRALGDQLPEPPPARRGGAVPNEDGLAALGQQMQRRPGAPRVANEAGLVALEEEIRRHRRSNGVRPTPSIPTASNSTGLSSAATVTDGSGHDGRSSTEAEGFDRDGDRARHRHAVHRRPKSWVRKGVVIGLAVVLVLVAGGAGYTYYLTHDLSRIHVRGLVGALTSGEEAGTENILMVGSTSRCSLTVQNPAYGLCSEGVNGVNSDVMMILHVDPTHHRLALLSIPRDLFVPNARAEGPNKIDAGLFQGVSQVVASLEEDFGIPIQHTVTLNFDQFANVVNALGGINMSFPMSVYDAESGLNVQAARCVHLNGTQALAVVRARHLQYQAPGITTPYAYYWPQETLSDLARIRRDHEFLRILGATAAKRGLSNPITDINLINSVKADLSFDENWSVTDMADLVLDFHSVNPNSVPQLTLPVSVVTDPDGAGGGLIYKGSGYGDAEFPAEAQDQATIAQVLGIDAATDSMTGAPLPSPATVTVSVVNGSGTDDAGSGTSSALGALGFHTIGIGEAEPAGDVAETVVYYGSRSPATEAAAEAVTRSMTGAVIMAYNPGQVIDGAQVTVVTGTDFAVNPPAPPTPTTAPGTNAQTSSPSTPAPAPTTTPTTAPVSTSEASGALAAASPSTSNLEPWDPRACPAGAIPTVPGVNHIG